LSVAFHILAAAFVTPAFAVAGLALASIPIIIHLLNRRRFKTVQWAAMEFLLRAMKKNRRRLKFEQWLLLATRCALLALLGLALARPMGCENSAISKLAAQRAGLHVILIDNSGSMAYEAGRPNAATNLARAKQLAKEQIDRLASGTESVAIVTSAVPARVELKATYDLDAARTAVDRIPQTYASTDIGGGLLLAMDLARAESRQPERHLHLFTDAARTAWEGATTDAIARVASDLVKVFDVNHYSVAAKDQTNAAATELEPSANLVTSQFPVDFLATLRSFGPSRTVQTQWKLDDGVLPGGGTMTIDTQSEPITQSNARFSAGGPHVVSVTVVGGDRLRADDTRYRVVDVASQLKTLIVEGERGGGLLDSSGTFLSLALSPPRAEGETGSGYLATEVVGELELGTKVLEDYATVILADVGRISSTQSEALARYVSDGGSLILFVGESVTAEAYNTSLLPRRLMPGALVKRMTATADRPPFTFDFKPRSTVHPMLAAFANTENSGLDTAQVFTYWQIALPAETTAQRVLDYLPPTGTSATTDTAAPRDPAITVHPLGAGRVVFFSTSANSEWTTLPAKPAYVAMMHELVGGSVTSGDAWMNRAVGQPLVLPQNLKLTTAPTLADPSGAPIAFRPGSSPPSTDPLPRPGMYWLNTGTRSVPVAVNMDPDESDVRTIDSGVIRKSLGETNVNVYDDTLPPLVSNAATSGNDFGWALMAIVLVLIGFESFLAMRFGHNRRG
jgi:hypothetical protein